jgi:hypothetical protein
MKTEDILNEILERIIELEKKLDIVNKWYPDNSGKWVENTYQNYPLPKRLESNNMVDVMTRRERISQDHYSCPKEAHWWNWTCDVDDPIVAFKVVNE